MTIEDIEAEIAELTEQMEKVVAAEETKKQVYTILQSFDVLFDVMDNADKKLLIKELIEKIDLYPRKNRSGQWVKTIYFKFPMYYNDSSEADCDVCFDMDGNFQPKRGTVETVVCLLRKKVDGHIGIPVNVDELGEIPHTSTPDAESPKNSFRCHGSDPHRSRCPVTEKLQRPHPQN